MNADLRASTYDPERQRGLHLSLLLSPKVNAWCVQDLANGQCLALQSGQGSSFPSEDMLPQRPSSISFVALPEISTLVPESALVPGTEMRHLRMVHGSIPTGLLRDEPISALGARCVYLHDEREEHRLLTRFPNARSLPLQAVAIQFALARSADRTVILLHRTDKRLDVTIAQDLRLLLSNTFHAVNTQDVLYYTLFTLEQCGARPESVVALICGTRMDEEMQLLLERYLLHTEPSHAPDGVQHAGLVNPHHWGMLLEQFACAS